MGRYRYVKIATRIWRDEKFSELSEKGKLLYLYLLTTHHSNMAGYYVLPELYVMEDLNWRRATLNKGFEELFKCGMVSRCSESCVVLVPRYFKYNRIENSNQARGVNRWVVELPANSLVEYFKAACKNYCARYYETLIQGLPKGLTKGFAKGLPKGFTKGFTKPFEEGLGKGFGKPETEAEPKPKPEPEAEKETPAENFPAASSEELKIINVLREVNGFPIDFEKDLEFLRELKNDFPCLSLLEEVKKWKAYKLDKPLNENSNPHSQLRKWAVNAEKWRLVEDEPSDNGREYNNELILTDRQMKLGGLNGEKC